MRKRLCTLINCIAYSFDKLLPIVKLRDEHYKIDLTPDSARYYFYLHQIIGWLLATFIAAGLSGLTQT